MGRFGYINLFFLSRIKNDVQDVNEVFLRRPEPTRVQDFIQDFINDLYMGQDFIHVWNVYVTVN